MHLEDLEHQALKNNYFRQVLATSKHVQVVIMSIDARGDIGEETHNDNDQVLYLVSGQGRMVLNGQEKPFKKGDLVLVPAGTKHNFISDSIGPMKIITTYSPPHHPDGTIHKTKAEADQAG